jgi:hypothetical protein
MTVPKSPLEQILDAADALGPQPPHVAVGRIRILCTAILVGGYTERRAAFVTIGALALAAIT